jgi:hypothetical protein
VDGVHSAAEAFSSKPRAYVRCQRRHPLQCRPDLRISSRRLITSRCNAARSQIEEPTELLMAQRVLLQQGRIMSYREADHSMKRCASAAVGVHA